MTCRHDGCRRAAMPSWTYCREHANALIVGRCGRDDDPSEISRQEQR